ncbi:MAG: hypothetical protein Q8K12_18000 [Thiobacillus sp.]|nr:hypothetical protein [Thiobacillus sp.]
MKSLWMKCQLALVLALTANGAAAVFDPMAPPKTTLEASASQDRALAWVRMNGRHSIASYGGRTVKLGDAVEGGRVSAIREDHIVISGKGGSRSIFLLDRTARSHPAH